MARLTTLADALYQRDAAEYQKVLAADRTLEAEAAKLAQPARSSATVVDPFQVAGGEENWTVFRTHKLREITSERARLRVEMELKREALRQSFGRVDALGRILRK